MQYSFRYGRHMSLTVLVVLLFSIFTTVTGVPLAQNEFNVSTLVTRNDGPEITFNEYVDYLKKYYPQTDKYLLYTGHSEDQVLAFKEKNPGYFYYQDFFHYQKSKHYLTEFPRKPNGDFSRSDNGETSSRAIAHVATKEVLVFGAADYHSFDRSTYFNYEAPELRERMAEGKLQAIKHMEKSATSPSQVLATEDQFEKITYMPGKHKQSNASACGKRRAVACGADEKTDKSGTNSGSERPYGSSAISQDHTGDIVDPNNSATNGKLSPSRVDAAAGRPVSNNALRFGRIP